jgi:L-phenylalanine/L-methionine N-acetyltransferase
MIRKATVMDLDFCYEMYMHESINPFLLYEEMTKELFKPIFLKLIDDQVKYIFSYEKNDVGMFKLIPNIFRASHVVYLGGLAIHPKFAGKGFGKLLLKEILDFTKTENFLRVELSVAIHNNKAINLYEEVGFVKEGILKKLTYLKSENKYLDEIMMAYFHYSLISDIT